MKREGMPPLDPEMRDALRLEVQTSSPKEREAYEREVEGVYHDFLAKWGEFVKEPIPKQEIANRFIGTDDETLQQHIYPDWFRAGDRVQAMHAMTDMVRKTVFMERMTQEEAAELWHNAREDVRERVREANGYADDADAVRRLRESTDRNTIAHEIAHLMQDNTLPHWFMEMGARWYGRQAEFMKAEHLLEGSIQRTLADHYDALLDEHGDLVHRMYFGSKSKRTFKRFEKKFAAECKALSDAFSELGSA